MSTASISRVSLIAELTLVTSSCVALASILYALRSTPWVGSLLSAWIALIFLYVPLIVLWRRGRTVDFFDRTVVDFWRGVALFAVISVIIFPPFLGLALLWQDVVAHAGRFSWKPLPDWGELVLFQVLMIALPEEVFFRGYFQSTIDRVIPRPWTVFGARLGWGWIITSVVFACAHSVVAVRWWHFSIFFPALVFGWLRARTGSITAPVLFHAACNVFMQWFANGYP